LSIIRITIMLGLTAAGAAPLCAQTAPPGSWVAPARAALRVNPLPPTADAVKRGRDLFHRDCEQCHGVAGHGDGPLGLSLQPRPANLPSEQVQSQSDGAFFWKITQGRGMMPTATLGENEKWAVIDYLRSLAARR
jgi:mono/diheme cytochrome c family protein